MEEDDQGATGKYNNKAAAINKGEVVLDPKKETDKLIQRICEYPYTVEHLLWFCHIVLFPSRSKHVWTKLILLCLFSEGFDKNFK